MASSSSPPSPPDPAPISKALAALRLAGRDQARRTAMDDADADLVLVVPDAPDRAATPEPDDGARARPRRGRDRGPRDAARDADHTLRRARLKRFLSGALDVDPAASSDPLSTNLDSEGNSADAVILSSNVGVFGDDDELRRRDKGKGIATGSEQVLPRLPRPDVPRRKVQYEWRTLNRLAPCSTTKSNTETTSKHVDGEADALFDGSSGQDKGETVREATSCVEQRSPGLDESASLYNAALDRNVVEVDAEKMSDEHVDGISRRKVNNIGFDFDVSRPKGRKGSAKLDSSSVGSAGCVKPETRPRRACWKSGNRVHTIADEDDNTLNSSKDLGWRTTRDRTEAASTYPILDISASSKSAGPEIDLSEHNRMVFVNLAQDSPEMNTNHELNPIAVLASSGSESECRKHHRQLKLLKGKRKCNSRRPTFDESSSSIIDDMDYSYSQPFPRRLNSKSNRTANSKLTICEPVTEVDKTYSVGVSCGVSQDLSGRVDDSSSRARQVESDETLARQLQEQFYRESSEFGGTEETDETIAWSLQEEEDARRAASIARNNRNRSASRPNRETSMSHLYAEYSQSNRNVSAQSRDDARGRRSRRDAQLARNFNNLDTDRETRMLAHLRNFNSAEMDRNTRLNFLEALQAAFDIDNDDGISSDILEIERDFNENDYEMLLSLDDNIRHLGASEDQINILPQSVIQSGSNQEACAICLELPSIGDTVRHLPCLHKFHTECIDPWLRRKTVCPICKSGIS